MYRHTRNGPSGGLPSATVLELSPDELYLSGTQYFRLRDYSSARACFERYLEERPEDAAAWHLLARVCLHQNVDLVKAELYIKKALEIDQGSETRYVETLGIIYIHRGMHASAEEVLSYALAKDPKDDPGHTASLKYYLELARKKNKGKDRHKGDEAGTPDFLAADMGRWRGQRRQALFLVPSFLLHALVLLVAFYLSTHELHFKKEFKEDFTYVDIEENKASPSPKEAASPPRNQQGEESQAPPAPVTPRKEAEAGDLQKGSSSGPGRVNIAENGGGGQRPAVGLKAGANLDAARSQDRTLLARAETADKGIEIKGGAMTHDKGDVNLVRKSLGEAASRGGGEAAREAGVSGLNERSGQTPASDDGIYVGGTKQDKSTRWEKGKLARLTEETRHEEAKAFPKPPSEKGLDMARPGPKDKNAARDETKDLQARPLSIGTGGPQSPARQDASGLEKPRSLDRASGEAGAAFAPGLNARSVPERSKGIGSSKARAVLEGTAYDHTKPMMGMTERRVDLPDTIGSRGQARAETVPMKKRLDMPGSSGASGSQGAGAGRAAREAFSSLGRRDAGTAAPAFGEGAALPASGALGGRKVVARSGKGVNPRVLGAEGGDVSGEGGGFLARAAEKVSGIFGLGGREGKGGMPDAQPRKAGDLSGLASAGRGGGAGTAKSGRPGGTGVRIGNGEKSRTAVSGVEVGGDLSVDEGGRAVTPGGKKMAEGLLGIPGGSGSERYATAGRGNARPAATEKRSGIGRGRTLARQSVGPVVAITSPTSGRTRQMSQVIRGTVSDPRTKKALLTINEDSRVISVERGAFESVVSIHKGRNIVTVTAFDMEGNAGKDAVTLDYSEPTEGAPVSIISPRDGQVFDVTERSVTRVKGTIGDQDIKKAKLILNDRPMDIVVNRGYFEQDVALVQEHNTILVEAANSDGQVTRSPLISVNTVNVKPKDVMIILTWDKPHADLDLHVYGPAGGHTYYKSPNIYESNEAIPGGQLEQDAKGNFGPEVYTQAKADRGIYSVKSNYYYSGGDGDCYATVTVILYGDNPSRRIVRVFGPHLQVDTKTGEDTWEITKIKMPEGIFLED